MVAPTVSSPVDEMMNGFHSGYAARSASTFQTSSGVAAISISVRRTVLWAIA
jgi:hypothetical protein